MIATEALEIQMAEERASRISSKDNVDWESLERQDWHLWILSIFLIFVLGISLLGFMFPAAFWLENGSQANLSQRAFFGFCALLGLLLVYLLQRQAAIRQLKRRLFEAQAALLTAEREAITETFCNLPDTAQFRDALAMEFRRASTTASALSGILVKAPNSSQQSLGKLAKKIRSTLRQGESLYRISDKALGVILPKMQLTEVRFFMGQLEDLGISAEVELDLTMASYPEEVSSLSELESRLRGLQARS